MEKILEKRNPNLILYETNIVDYLDKKIYEEYKHYEIGHFPVIEQFTLVNKKF